MKTPIFVLAGALVASAVPTHAQEIVVSAESVAIEAVSRDLDRSLLRASSLRRDAMGEGIAMVRFERGADGLPTNVEIYHGSGNMRVDRLARTAVSRLGRGSPLPAIGGPGQVYQANIIVAFDDEQFDTLSARLASLESKRLSDPDERAVFAFVAGTRKAS